MHSRVRAHMCTFACVCHVSMTFFLHTKKGVARARTWQPHVFGVHSIRATSKKGSCEVMLRSGPPSPPPAPPPPLMRVDTPLGHIFLIPHRGVISVP